MSSSSENTITRRAYPRCIATISAGFEKGDFLVREEKGQRVYFDFFEEAFNYIAAKGYSRMPKVEEEEWMDLMVSLFYIVLFITHVIVEQLDEKSDKSAHYIILLLRTMTIYFFGLESPI
jgi:hypothetical protein